MQILDIIQKYQIGAIIFIVISIISNWVIFKKAGQPGWKIFIPVYNEYMKFKIAWKPGMFWISILLGFVGGFISTYNKTHPLPFVVVCIGLALFIIGVLIELVLAYKTSCAFGHGIGFALGLIFLNPVFLLILAFGKSKYQGPQ